MRPTARSGSREVKRSLLSSLATFLTAAVTAFAITPPDRFRLLTPFGPCDGVPFFPEGQPIDLLSSNSIELIGPEPCVPVLS
jgi:hypothetical protein